MQSVSRRVLSDVVAPKRIVTDQMFRDPPPRIRTPVHNGRRRLKIIVLLLIVLSGGTIESIRRAQMEVRVTPRTATIKLDTSAVLTRNQQDKNKLFVRTISVNDIRDGIFPGSFTAAPVERRARGTVVIFNKSSQTPQVLIATTRLETPDGKVYRIPKTVTVPGYSRQNNEIIPGSREVEVIADRSGEEYNVGLTDFVIPGFKGGPKFETIFARSKTEISGGFLGTEQTIRAEDLERAIISLRTDGEASARGLVRAKVPDNMFLFNDSIEYVIIDRETKLLANRNDVFQLVLRAEARGAIVEQDEIAKLVRDSPLPFSFRIANIMDLNYKLEEYSYDGDPGLMRVSGDAVLESLVNAGTIKEFITVKRVSSSRNVLEAFTELESVIIRFRPFWLRRAPSDPARIDIITVAS